MLSMIFKYSASYAKVKAMSGKLLKAEDYEALLSKSSVNDVAAYLKNNTHYSAALAGLSDREVHRGELEQELQEAMAKEFVKLIRFEKGKNKEFLLLFVLKYEIELLKDMLRMCESGNLFVFNVFVSDYYKKHMTIDVEKLASSATMAQFLENLKGSRYYKMLAPFIAGREHASIFNIEMMLDLYYFSTTWRLIDSMLGKKDKQLVTESFGSETDILNIMWIYRSKKYFNMPREIIYSFIIPHSFKLNHRQLAAMVDARNVEELLDLVSQTPYAEIFEQTDSFTEQHYYEYTMKIQRKAARLAPFSIMSMIVYIHGKESEVNNIIKIIEGIRYKLDMNEIRRYLIRKTGDA